AGQLRAQARAGLCRERRRDVGDQLGLFMNRFNDAPVSVPDVHAHQLAVEIDKAFALGRPEVHAFGPRDRNRRDVLLRGPLENRVLLRERDDRFARHSVRPYVERRTSAGRLTANSVTSSTPAMKPPMCAMNATPPPAWGPCPMTPNALIS